MLAPRGGRSDDDDDDRDIYHRRHDHWIYWSSLFSLDQELLCAKLSLLLPWLKASLPMVRLIGGRDCIFSDLILAVWIRCAMEAYEVDDLARRYNDDFARIYNSV